MLCDRVEPNCHKHLCWNHLTDLTVPPRMATPSDSDQALFETVDWDEVGGRSRRPSARTLAFLVGLVALAALYAYNVLYVHVYLAFRWDVSRLDWLFMLALLAAACYVLPPVLRHPRLARRFWRRYSRDREAAWAAGYLALFFVAGTLGPFLLGPPDIQPSIQFQPPPFFGIERYDIVNCVGQIVGDRCYGSFQYPLGTNKNGYDMLRLVVAGWHVALYVAAVSSAFIVPIATAVGIAAGYRGGLLDAVLMRYVEFQQTLPAFAIYLLVAVVYGKSLFLIVVIFGLTAWGGVARVVRSEVLQRREAGFVRAAESTGAGTLHVVRRHLLPNVSNAVVTSLGQLVPLLILTEVGLAFLGYSPFEAHSFGNTMAKSFNTFQVPFPQNWWVGTVAGTFLMLTVGSFKVAGDALRDALDPREGEG